MSARLRMTRMRTADPVNWHGRALGLLVLRDRLELLDDACADISNFRRPTPSTRYCITISTQDGAHVALGRGARREVLDVGVGVVVRRALRELVGLHLFRRELVELLLELGDLGRVPKATSRRWRGGV